MWPKALLHETPEIYPAPDFASADARVRPVFFEGARWQGRPTRVFAWLGLPELAPGKTCPGIVLIHGGTGTAFDWWVRMWVERGYAAIAMDTCGAVPNADYREPYPRHDFGGPAGWGAFERSGDAPEDQWAFHAVSAVARAHSLLRAQPGVDATRVGVTGISWGGFLTCLTAAVDGRFAFAAPVYGCGNYELTTFEKSLKKFASDGGARWRELWDPAARLAGLRVPSLWVNGTNDDFFWPPAWQASYRRVAPGRRTVCLIPRMEHSHEAGARPAELAVFADSVLRGGPGLAKVRSVTREGREVRVGYEAPAPVTRAELIWTADAESPWPKREWRVEPGRLTAEDEARAMLPEGARFWFVNLVDERGCVVSTEHEALV